MGNWRRPAEKGSIGSMWQKIFAWVLLNPELVLALAVGAIANLAQRPDTKNLVGWRAAFWKGIDLLCFLDAQRFPKFKWFFTLSQSTAAGPTAALPVPTPPGEVKIIDNETPDQPAKAEDKNNGKP